MRAFTTIALFGAAAAVKIQKNFSMEDVQEAMWKVIDSDGSNTLSKDEAAVVVNEVNDYVVEKYGNEAAMDVAAEIDEAWDLFDEDLSGELCLDEVEKMHKAAMQELKDMGVTAKDAAEMVIHMVDGAGKEGGEKDG